MELYYDGPFQLKFWRHDLNMYHYGIGYHERIVDVHDGSVFSTKEIIERAPCDEDDAIVEYMDWSNLSDSF